MALMIYFVVVGGGWRLLRAIQDGLQEEEHHVELAKIESQSKSNQFTKAVRAKAKSNMP